ncbi:MAG: thermonuclease family protein [Methanothrix sp.]|nr:thermonuclease family protein [Methanothrix sp.]
MRNIAKIFHILVALLLLLPSALAAQEASGEVINVVDGDTIDVQLPTQEIGIRMADIDTPEMSTDNGPVAKEFTTQWLYGKNVALDLDNQAGQDNYGRWVAVVYLQKPDGSLENFNRKLFDSGQECIWDFDNNEFNPADWWNGTIPESACFHGEASGAAQPYIGPTYGWAGPGKGALPGSEDDNFFTSGASQASSAASTTSGGPFVGSSKSNKYHYPTCSAAKKIKASNLITFGSSEEARAAGYVPCGICHPP